MKTTSPKGYLIVFAILLGLAFLNIFIATADVGGWNGVLIMIVASIQAFMLAAIFMHLRESPKLIWIVVGSGFFFVATLAVFVLADNAGRASQQQPRSWELPATVTLPAAPAAAK